MLDGNDKETFYNIRLLRDQVNKNNKPIIFWIGSGTSAWCKYPLWAELADKFHSSFNNFEGTYDSKIALDLIAAKKYPEFFKLCKETNHKTYFNLLSTNFVNRKPSDVYKRFINLISEIKPLYILTTNVDQLLENNLSGITIVERSDLERCIDFMQSRIPFICKLHGSISSVQSTVFTSNDYVELLSNGNYLRLIQHIFTEGTVVFLGYSLSDDYVLKSLLESSSQKPIFGDGPHFLITMNKRTLPDNLKLILYKPEPHKDHRSAIQVIEIIREARKATITVSADENKLSSDDQRFISAYYISDIYPPGTWTTSETAQVTRNNGQELNITTGQGFDASEMPLRISTAMHDLIVGLICFDTIFIPLRSLYKVHELLGSNIFWSLVRDGVFKFVDVQSEPAFFSPSDMDSGSGYLQITKPLNPDKSHYSIDQIIRKQLEAREGREQEAEQHFSDLKKHVVSSDDSRKSNTIDLMKGSLLHSSIRQILGMSDAILPSNIPRWLMFPALRLAHIIRIGEITQHCKILAIKIPFGGEKLAGVAFSATAAQDWAEDSASYVLTGRFNSDLGEFVFQDLGIVINIMKFRDTQAGISFRQEILENLLVNTGNEFYTSVNAGLSCNIPTNILQKAHDQLSGLYAARGQNRIFRATPAVWNNMAYSDEAVKLWRVRSAKLLKEFCNSRDIKSYDLCPCGSGEKLRFCCQESLNYKE